MKKKKKFYRRDRIGVRHRGRAGRKLRETNSMASPRPVTPQRRKIKNQQVLVLQMALNR